MAGLNSQVVPISQVALKTGFTLVMICVKMENCYNLSAMQQHMA